MLTMLPPPPVFAPSTDRSTEELLPFPWIPSPSLLLFGVSGTDVHTSVEEVTAVVEESVYSGWGLLSPTAAVVNGLSRVGGVVVVIVMAAKVKAAEVMVVVVIVAMVAVVVEAVMVVVGAVMVAVVVEAVMVVVVGGGGASHQQYVASLRSSQPPLRAPPHPSVSCHMPMHWKPDRPHAILQDQSLLE